MRKKIKRFFKLFHLSFLPQHSFYQKILLERLRTSFIYFLVLTIIFSLITWINILLRFYFSNFQKNLVESLKRYPSDLVIYLKENFLFTNFDRPYIFWWYQNNLPTPLIVIDTNLDHFKPYPKDKIYDKTPFLVGDRGVFVRWGKKVQFYPFSFGKEVRLDKKVFDSLAGFVRKYFWAMLMLFLIFWSTVFTIKNLVFIFVLSLLSLVFLRFTKKRKVNLRKNYQIGLHCLTLPLVYYFLFVNIFPSVILSFRFALAYFLLSLIFYFGAFYEVYFDK